MNEERVEFVEFATTRARALFHTAYLLTGDWHLAEDLVQITLGKAYANWPTVRRTDNPVAYTQTMLVRTYLSHRRKRSSGELPSERLPDAFALDDADPALRVTLHEALGRLSARDRAIVVLRYWEDRSVEETARLLGVRPGVVKAQSMRALARLRDLLGQDLNEMRS